MIQAVVHTPGLIVVAVLTLVPSRIHEALRAAVGLTLRGDAVVVVLPDLQAVPPTATRLLTTLLAMGHQHQAAMDADLITRANAIEVWT